MKEVKTKVSLKDYYAKGSSGHKITDEIIQKVENYLIREYVQKGKKFTTKDVAEYLATVVNYKNAKHPKEASITGARRVLKKLGVL